MQTLVFPEPVPLFAAFRSNKEGEITTAKMALKEQRFVVTDVLLGDQAFSDAEFRAAYGEAQGWVLTHKQLPKQRRSWKHDLFAYRKETIELLWRARDAGSRHQRLSDERRSEKRGVHFSRSLALSELLAAKLSRRQTASDYQRTD